MTDTTESGFMLVAKIERPANAKAAGLVGISVGGLYRNGSIVQVQTV